MLFDKILNKDNFIGCLVGGALGDAMGYQIEFMNENEIKQKYGFVKDFMSSSKISDDTQMTLYTATGLLLGLSRVSTRGVGSIDDPIYVFKSYKTWLDGQLGRKSDELFSFLANVEHFNERRHPGNTCLSALNQAYSNEEFGTIEKPINSSKGCGGVMRVSPVGLFYSHIRGSSASLAAECGAKVSAITHGHSLSIMSSAYLSCLIYLLVWSQDLEHSVIETNDVVFKMFEHDKHINEFKKIINKARELSKSTKSDINAIHELGSGWVAEEALAIALYCSLKHKDSFIDAIAAAINHGGDSDSTGSICGNIIGALMGIDKIEQQFPSARKLEFYDLIGEIASDLYDLEFGENIDLIWSSKYLYFSYNGERTYADREKEDAQLRERATNLNSDDYQALAKLIIANSAGKEWVMMSNCECDKDVENFFEKLNIKPNFYINYLTELAKGNFDMCETINKIYRLSIHDLGSFVYSLIDWRKNSDPMAGQFRPTCNMILGFALCEFLKRIGAIDKLFEHIKIW